MENLNTITAPDLIKVILENKRSKNKSYSLNALSRDLGISQPHLTKIANGKCRLSPQHAFKIGTYLELDDSRMMQLLRPTFVE